MLIVTIKTSNEIVDVLVADVKGLLTLLSVLESSEKVKAYKISRSEGVLITNLRNSFGIGEYSKFTTKFIHSVSDYHYDSTNT